jgi:hypothetical protein
MAILDRPLFSAEARGQVAKTAVFKRGVFHPVYSALAYHRVTWSPAKIAQARAWKILCNQWRALSYAEKAAWRASAPGVLTGFNFFMQSAGVLPYPPCYVSPGSDSLFFDFSLTGYAPPAPDQLTFIFPQCEDYV